MLANIAYLIALGLLSPFILYRVARYGRYRRGVSEKLFGLSAERATEMVGENGCVWFHAVSVGEVNLLPGVIGAWKQRAGSGAEFVVSTSTDSGYDLAVQRFGADRVFFCPLDFSWSVARTIRNLAPRQLVLAELELWPNLIRTARRAGCSVQVINGRLSERSAHRYRQFGRVTRGIFASLDWVGCQDETCRQHFADCGTPPERLSVTGSLKFDDAPSSRDCLPVHQCAEWAGIDPWQRVWLVGSTQPGEEDMAIKIYRELRVSYPELRLIIVPRHSERFDEVANLIVTSDLRVRRRSRDIAPQRDSWNQDEVILIDTIGELRAWWGTAQIATVGGSFGDRGGQNMLEPAGYGCAVSFGPDTRNFRQIATMLLDAGGAVRVHHAEQLKEFVQRCLDDATTTDALGAAAREVIQAHQGATQRTIDALCLHSNQAIEKAA